MMPQPFFETAPREGQQRRRLLLISYHFPPDRTVGARRWEHLARFAAERGWGMDVVTCLPEAAPEDRARLEALPPGIRVFGAAQPSLLVERLEHAAYSAYLRVARPPRAPAVQRDGAAATGMRPVSVAREAIHWPPRGPRDVMRSYWAWVAYERQGSWARAAARVARQVLQEGVHRAVVSSGPPHMAHDAARAISVEHDLPFVMDMRDPWSLTPRLHEHVASPLWLRLARRYERRCLERAALIVANNEPARDALVAAYPAIEERAITVLNGTDEYPVPPSRYSDRFLIRHAGTIYITRDVEQLLRAAARVVQDEALTAEQFGVDFIGNLDEPGEASIVELARRVGLADYVTVGSTRPHPEALDFLSRAAMLVIFSGFGDVTLPAKTFEYMRFDAWLLAMGGPRSALARLLRGTDADVVAPENLDAMTAVIARRYAQFRAGERPRRVARDDRFGRASQAAILLDALERAIDQADERRALAARS